MNARLPDKAQRRGKDDLISKLSAYGACLDVRNALRHQDDLVIRHGPKQKMGAILAVQRTFLVTRNKGVILIDCDRRCIRPRNNQTAYVYGLSSGASISYARSTTLAGRLIVASRAQAPNNRYTYSDRHHALGYRDGRCFGAIHRKRPYRLHRHRKRYRVDSRRPIDQFRLIGSEQGTVLGSIRRANPLPPRMTRAECS